MFEQVWNQVEHITTLSNSTQVITDADIVINNMQIIPPNKNASLHPIHLISQTKGVNITISNCLIKGLRLMFDNANISLYIENSTFTAAGISIQSEENTEHLPVHIQSCHFSGHFPEDTLLFTNTDNVSIESCHFPDLQLSNNESSIIKGQNSFLHIVHSIFTNNTEPISIHGGSSQIINCSFTKSRSCLKAEDTTVNISMSQFDGNTNGCIVGKNAILYIVDSNLTSNIAEQNGGAVNISSSQVTLDNCLLINNTAQWYNPLYRLWWWADNRAGRWDGDGGAVYAVNSCVTLGNCSLINNTAGYEGGAVSATDNSHVTLGNCSLINNTAGKGGGAVSAKDNSRVTLGNCSLINNIAGDDGGAVYAGDNSKVTLGNCSLINNTARDDGGAVYADNSHVTLGNCSLVNNTAKLGGAVNVWIDSHVTLGKCSLINNTARRGGVVYAGDNSKVTLGNCSLINNTAWDDGGAVYAVLYSQGAVYARYNSHVRLSNCSLINNTAGNHGGAVYAWDNSHVTLGNCSLINNTAGGKGGAVSAVNSYLTLSKLSLLNNASVHARYISQVQLSNCSLINNKAGEWGGAVNAYNNHVVLGNCSLINNTAEEWGGGAVYASDSHVTLGNCLLINNTAEEWGGGAVYASNSHVTLGNCSLINNTALWGGAVYAEDNSHITFVRVVSYTIFFAQRDLKGSVLLTDSHLNSNMAGYTGGAIQVEDAQITMMRCSLSNNQAKQNGGAINIYTGSEKIGPKNILIDNNFTGNTAMNGGALRVIRRKVTLKGCCMIDNSAKKDGGAIKIDVLSVIHMASVQFVNNTAGSGGGAVMVLDHSELLDTGSIFMQNLARGFGEYGSTFVTLEG